MHPTLSRYLSLDALAKTLTGSDIGGGPDERALLEVAARHPEQKRLVLSASSSKRADPEAQEAVVFLAAHAALSELKADPAWKEKLEVASAALQGDGADAAEVDGILAALLVEEGLGYDDDPDSFDRAFFEESVRSLPSLSKLSEDRVTSLRSAFVLASPKDEKRIAEVVAEALTEVAWSDGPEPLNPEHLHATLELCEDRLSKKDWTRAPSALARYLDLLADAKLVGPLRKARLDEVLSAVLAPPALA